MKKLNMFLCGVIATTIVVSGCGKSEAAENADALISRIGEVTIDSKEHIELAEICLQTLEKSDLKKVDGIDILENARLTYDQLIVELESEEVENAIRKIGTLTLNSGVLIADARKVYDSISENAKLGVGNYEVLEKAEIQFFELKVDQVIDAIDEIGDVTLNSADVISAAKKVYDNADADVRAEVSNYEVLEKAEIDFSNMLVEHVVNSINDIGVVTIDSKGKIEDTYKNYNLLSDEEKKRVGNIEELKTMRSEVEALDKLQKEQRKVQLLNKMKTNYDKIQEFTWYQHTNQPQYINTRSYMLPYIAKNNEGIFLLTRFHYTGDDWIFFDEIVLWIDGDKHTVSFNFSDINRDNGRGYVWEEAHLTLSNIAEIQALKDVGNSTETIIRFEGKDGIKYYDSTVSAADKQAILEVIELYELLKLEGYN